MLCIAGQIFVTLVGTSTVPAGDWERWFRYSGKLKFYTKFRFMYYYKGSLGGISWITGRGRKRRKSFCQGSDLHWSQEWPVWIPNPLKSAFPLKSHIPAFEGSLDASSYFNVSVETSSRKVYFTLRYLECALWGSLN